jgi:hypothetical protein
MTALNLSPAFEPYLKDNSAKEGISRTFGNNFREKGNNFREKGNNFREKGNNRYHLNFMERENGSLDHRSCQNIVIRQNDSNKDLNSNFDGKGYFHQLPNIIESLNPI